MLLYLIRHAWAEPAGDVRWPDDAQRPLTKQGRERFSQMVKVLSRRGFEPCVLASSPACRCIQTAQIIADRAPAQPKIVTLEDLASPSNLPGLLEWVQQHARQDDEVAWVGHAPDVGNMAAALLGAEGGTLRFAKGAVAALWFDGYPRLQRAELQWLVSAKILGC